MIYSTIKDHNSLYTLADNKLQLSSDLEDLKKTNDQKSTNSHKSELVITYDTNAGNNALHPSIFYALYIGSNDDSNGHLIYKLYMNQILVTMEYQSVPVPEDLIKEVNETNSSDNKIYVDHFDNNYSLVRDNHSNNNNDDDRTHFNDENNSEDESYDELDSSQQLNGTESNKIIDQENQTLLIVESSESVSLYVKHTEITKTSTFLQGLFLQCLHKVVITTLYLQPSLPVSVHEDILCHL